MDRSQFLEDCIREAGVKEVEGWEHPTHITEFLRFTRWVRRVIEEVNWWELNGEAKNINRHLQIRLISIYSGFVNTEILPEPWIYEIKMIRNEGVAPAQATWDEWYSKRAIEAEKWYKHWCSHIGAVPGAASGNNANRKLMRFRDVYQLLCKNKRSYK